ncbi:MAG: sigma-E processing peptidase SpoIIGA [Bacilli bacterium]|nr:sigma-E processing peptidase SpoIIGA [Bacilli bacterium]
MTIYVDLIFFVNFAYDFLLLLTVGIVLKRKVKLYRHMISAFIGALSIFLLFLSWNETLLFILKIVVSILMCVVSFKYISLRYTFNNLCYLYMCSVILAGFLYYLDLEFSYHHEGIIFFFDGVSINYVLLIILAPIVLVWYIHSSKKLKSTYNLYYNLEIYFDNLKINCLSLFDNGNSLKDIVTGKPVIIVNKKIMKGIYNIRDPMYIPFNTVSGSGLMKCYKPSYIILNNQKIYNYLIGISDCNFSDGVEAILNVKLLEDKYV